MGWATESALSTKWTFARFQIENSLWRQDVIYLESNIFRERKLARVINLCTVAQSYLSTIHSSINNRRKESGIETSLGYNQSHSFCVGLMLIYRASRYIVNCLPLRAQLQKIKITFNFGCNKLTT